MSKEVQPGLVYTNKKNPEERNYLILFIKEDKSNENNEIRDFEWVIGRIETYNYIKNLLLEGDLIDIYKSFVIAETVSIMEALTIYAFMKHVRENVNDDSSFDIEEYNIGEEINLNEEQEK